MLQGAGEGPSTSLESQGKPPRKGGHEFSLEGVVSQVDRATKGHPYQGNSMCGRDVRWVACLGNYKKLDVSMFEGVSRGKAGVRSCRESHPL